MTKPAPKMGAALYRVESGGISPGFWDGDIIRAEQITAGGVFDQARFERLLAKGSLVLVSGAPVDPEPVQASESIQAAPETETADAETSEASSETVDTNSETVDPSTETEEEV